MKVEQSARALRIDDPLFRIIEVVGIQKPNGLGSGDDPFHQHPASEVEMAPPKRDNVEEVPD